MTDLIPGKRYRVTIDGYVPASGRNLGIYTDVDTRLPESLIRIASVELLPDPLPITPGSVILDQEGDAWQLFEQGAWLRVGRDGYQTSSHVAALGPFTVLFDAGAPRD